MNRSPARSLRIIGGMHRGRRLVAPAGRSTRPPLDLQRETLFNILGPALPGAVVVDLFAGSGSLGLEALSRGAREVVFVERDPAALRALDTNRAALGVEAASRVVRGDAFRFPDVAGGGPERIDVAFVDPPFPRVATPEGWRRLQALLGALASRAADPAVLVVRLPRRAPAPPAPPGCRERNVRLLGLSRVHFLRFRKETGPA